MFGGCFNKSKQTNQTWSPLKIIQSINVEQRTFYGSDKGINSSLFEGKNFFVCSMKGETF